MPGQERRAALLNENPNRVANDPQFVNHHPEALTGEIQQFLGRKRIDPSAFRVSVPLPGEHAPTAQAFQAAKQDKELEAALTNSILERIQLFKERLATQGELNWTYSTDGLLSVGSKEESKHSVVGAGADVWAAGTVKVKLTDAETSYRRHLHHVEKSEGYERQAAASETNAELSETDRRRKAQEFRANAKYFGDEANRDRLEAESLDFKPQDAERIGKTVVLDFDSGHYTPSEAWRRTVSAWNQLGYTVEFNPLGRHT